MTVQLVPHQDGSRCRREGKDTLAVGSKSLSERNDQPGNVAVLSCPARWDNNTLGYRNDPCPELRQAWGKTGELARSETTNRRRTSGLNSERTLQRLTHARLWTVRKSMTSCTSAASQRAQTMAAAAVRTQQRRLSAPQTMAPSYTRTGRSKPGSTSCHGLVADSLSACMLGHIPGSAQQVSAVGAAGLLTMH